MCACGVCVYVVRGGGGAFHARVINLVGLITSEICGLQFGTVRGNGSMAFICNECMITLQDPCACHNYQVDQLFEHEIIRLKELCSHMDISVSTLRKIPLFSSHTFSFNQHLRRVLFCRCYLNAG